MLKTFPLLSRAETTALKHPKEVFCFSRNGAGEWSADENVARSEAVSYFYFPDSYVDANYDLLAGIKTFQKIPEEDNVADFPLYLSAIKQHEQKTGKKTRADIITFRGIMTKLLTLPYNLNNQIQLYVVAFDGQLFIKNDDELDMKNRAAEATKNSPDQDRYLQVCEYGGYKFETLVTLPKPWAECSRASIEKRNKKVVSNYEQYISVVTTGIGKVRTLLAGEVDCVWDYLPDEKDDDVLSHYVELKTSRAIDKPHQVATFEKKLFRTWAQCFLLGIKRIVYGFRDDKHILRDVEIYNTEEVPLLIKNNNIPQNGAKIVCINALKWYGAVLEWIHKSIDLGDELKAYKITYDPGLRTFSLAECIGDENKTLRGGALLTEDFKEWRKQLAEKP